MPGAPNCRAQSSQAGANGWTEADGCPLYTDDDFPRAVQQMEDILNKFPNLDAFIPTGGFPQFIPDGRKLVTPPVVDGVPCGVFGWKPPAALVEELSDVLDEGAAG